MTSMQRLSEISTSAKEQALLAAGRGVTASPEMRARVLAGLGLETPVSAPRRSSRFPRRVRRLALAAMVVSTLAAAAPAVYWSLARQPQVPAAAGVRSLLGLAARDTAVLPERAAATTAVHPTSVATSSPLAGTEPTQGKTGPSTLQKRQQAGKALDANRLGEELAALDGVRQRMRGGDPRGALLSLDAFGRDFQRPRLALEAEVLRIFALDQAGQKDVAKRRAEAFIVKYPKGVLSARVRRYLER